MNSLEMALHRNIGNVLTPELAAGIVLSTNEQKAPLSGDSFPPLVHGKYTIRTELLSQVLPEIYPLHAAHWKETEQYRHSIPLNPDYEYIISCEDAGRFILFTIRTDLGELVGNCMMYLTRSTHTRKLIAEEDTIFIRADHRKGRLGIKLIGYVEDALSSIGATEIRVTVKTVNRVDALLKALGYTHTANQLTKVLGDSDVQ